MKGYHDQRYPVSIEVKVTDPTVEPFVDEIKGLNPGHALYRAKLNWPGLEVRVLNTRSTTNEQAD